MGASPPNQEPTTQNGSPNNENDDWDAVWSDDDEKKGVISGLPPMEGESTRTRTDNNNDREESSKRRKVFHYRSQLASLLKDCSEMDQKNKRQHDSNKSSYLPVTEYVGTLGPSAIDVSLSTLCNGMHDLEEGLPLLILASRWLIEACQSRERFDAVNAYLHRFLYLHANILSGIDEMSTNENEGREGFASATDAAVEQRRLEKQQRNELAICIVQLKQAQRNGAETLQEEMQNKEF